MVKKKKPEKGFLLRSFIFVVKIPYYAFKGISFLVKKSDKAMKKRKVMKKRSSIMPIYKAIEIIHSGIGDYKKWEDSILGSESKIGVILGARGSGKTAFGIKLLENIHAKTRKKCYAIGFREEEMPSWIKTVSDMSQLTNDSFVLVDEGGILFSSRNFMSNANKLLSELILIARHKNLNILFISQNCLPETQKILTPGGIKSLGELKVEDLVYSFDFDKNKLVPAIAKKSSGINKKIVKIYLEDGRILKSSEDHKWIVYNKDGLSEKKAKDLNKSKDYLIDVSSKKEKL